jgi:hypothetical protein
MCKTFPFWDYCHPCPTTDLKEQRRRHSGAKYGNPFYSWLSVAVFGVITAVVVATFWTADRGDRLYEEDMRKWKNWPAAIGIPSETRIVKQATLATRRRIPWYLAECRVEYSVAGKRYSVWGRAYVDTDPKWLADEMRTCPFSEYEVHYDPSQPWVAHAFIADHP